MDTRDDVADEKRIPAIVDRILSDAIGEPCTTVSRLMWPSPKLPGSVEQWMEEDRPDVVFIKIGAYPYVYHLVAAQMERQWPAFLRPLAEGARSLSYKKWFVENPLMWPAKQLSRKIVGRSTYFEPEEVVQVLETVIRRVVRREDCTLVVRGPFLPIYLDPRLRAWADARSAVVDTALARICAALHVDYISGAGGLADADEVALRLPDVMHYTEEGHRYHGEKEAGYILEAWRRFHGVDSTAAGSARG